MSIGYDSGRHTTRGSAASTTLDGPCQPGCLTAEIAENAEVPLLRHVPIRTHRPGKRQTFTQARSGGHQVDAGLRAWGEFTAPLRALRPLQSCDRQLGAFPVSVFRTAGAMKSPSIGSPRGLSRFDVLSTPVDPAHESENRSKGRDPHRGRDTAGRRRGNA